MARALVPARVMESLTHDVRFAIRTLTRNPLYAGTVVLTLALAAGGNTAIFSLINASLWRPLAGVQEPERLARLTRPSFSYPLFEALTAEGLFDVVAFHDERLPVEHNGAIHWSRVLTASGSYYPTLGIAARLGRTFGPEEDRAAAPVAVLSHAFWTRACGGDRGIVGATIRIDGVPLTIVGVTPPEFTGVVTGVRPDITVPLSLVRQFHTERDWLTARTMAWLKLMVRLEDGQSLAQADARLQTMWPRLLAAAAPPDAKPDSRHRTLKTNLVSAAHGFPYLAHFESPLHALMALVVLVLLIACANVAGLAVARGASRERELAVRTAMGAGGTRLVGQLLVESSLLALLGTSIGLMLSAWASRGLVGVISTGVDPLFLDLGLDWRVAGFSIGLTIMITLLAGLAPAVQAARRDPAASLRAAGRLEPPAAGWLRRTLLVAQVAASVLLVAGAGLFVTTLHRVLTVDAGFDATDVLLVRVDAVSVGHRGPTAVTFYRALIDRLASQAGVLSASASYVPPVSAGEFWNDQAVVEGTSVSKKDAPWIWHNVVSPRYFETIGQRLVAGRDFTWADGEQAPKVVIINETMARRFFGQASALGERLLLGDGRSSEVVGVVKDAKYDDLKEGPREVAYRPFAQHPGFLEQTPLVLELRSAVVPAVLAAGVRRALADVAGGVPFEIQTLRGRVAETLAQERLLAMLATSFGALSLLLVGVGTYGITAYSAARRTREIGIRSALGAPRRALATLVLGEALGPVMAGLAVGIPVALGLARFVEKLLFGVEARDAITFMSTAAVIVTAALLAGALPARRAARLEPSEALRRD